MKNQTAQFEQSYSIKKLYYCTWVPSKQIYIIYNNNHNNNNSEKKIV